MSEKTGSVLWTQPVMNGDHSSPALSRTDMYVSYACGLLYAFDRRTGQQRWFSNGPCEGGGGKTPVYHSGRVRRDRQCPAAPGSPNPGGGPVSPGGLPC